MVATTTSTGEGWSSRTTFILAAIGAAVGLGNIWRFPTLAGESGGGAFVFFYIACVFLLGLPRLKLLLLPLQMLLPSRVFLMLVVWSTGLSNLVLGKIQDELLLNLF